MVSKIPLSLFAVILSVLLFSLVSPVATKAEDGSPAEDVFTLTQAVERGLQANPRMAAIKAQVLGAEFGEKSARAAFGPALSAGYDLTYNDSPTFGRDRDSWTLNLNLSQPLFTGWRLLNTHQRSQLFHDAAMAELEARELELILLIQEEFLELLKARENVRSAEDSVTRLRSQLQTVQAFFDVGLRPKLDVLQAEVDLATAEQLLLIARNTVLTQEARLNTLLDLGLESPVKYVGELVYIPYAPALETSLGRAMANRPDLRLALQTEAIAGKDAEITASDFYPQVSADLDYFRRSNDSADELGRTSPEDSWWTAGVRVNWRAFEWGRTKYAYEQSKQNVIRLREETAELRLEISFAVKSLHLKLEEASARIAVARKALEEAREGFRIAQARYQAQVGTNTDVLDAQARLTRGEADLTEALVDYQLALARLFTARGEQNPGLVVP